MKKLFKAIRQGELDEVKAVIEKNPEAVNCVAVPPPKKDNGQSPLQVALKTGNFDIANYLIDSGADINFMEPEDDDPGLRAPVLHDAINAVFGELCCSGIAGFQPWQLERSEKALALVERILETGADVNKLASNDFDAWDCTVHELEFMERYESWETAKQQADKIFRLLESYGADKNAWLDRTLGTQTNRELYVDDFVPQPDRVVTSPPYRGKTRKTVIKGDVDRTAKMREFMRKYFEER